MATAQRPMLPQCSIFSNKLVNMPVMAELTRDHYCRSGTHDNCARFMVVHSLGSSEVPQDLYPNQQDRVEAILKAGNGGAKSVMPAMKLDGIRERILKTRDVPIGASPQGKSEDIASLRPPQRREGKIRQEMKYLAIITINFTDLNPNDYQQLMSALIALGWVHIETSALMTETSDLSEVWGAFDLIPRQCADAGTLSALSIQVQRLGESSEPSRVKIHSNAIKDIRQKPFPEYRSLKVAT
jgi:hypothetical protein